MTIIKKLSEMIEEEIKDAEKYAKCALKHKEDHPALADLFNRLSGEELQHMNLLHDKVVDLIEDYKNEHGEPPEAMKAVYDYLHEKQIEEAANVKILRAMYKE